MEDNLQKQVFENENSDSKILDFPHMNENLLGVCKWYDKLNYFSLKLLENQWVKNSGLKKTKGTFPKKFVDFH